jgi:hypothetical protein
MRDLLEPDGIACVMVFRPNAALGATDGASLNLRKPAKYFILFFYCYYPNPPGYAILAEMRYWLTLVQARKASSGRSEVYQEYMSFARGEPDAVSSKVSNTQIRRRGRQKKD